MVNIFFVLVKEYICQFLHNIMMLKGARAVRAQGVLIVRNLYKCTLSILVPNLFLNRQGNFSIHHILDVFKKSGWTKNRLETKTMIYSHEMQTFFISFLN